MPRYGQCSLDLANIGDESDDDEFEIQFESKAGGNDRGDSEFLEDEASGSVDGGGERVEYVRDINHNAEKLCWTWEKNSSDE